VFSVGVSPTKVNEGGNATFTILTLRPAAHSVTVFYSMSGKAKQGTDYTLSGTPGRVTLAPYQYYAQVTLHAIQDHDGGILSETAKMTLLKGNGYKVSVLNNATVAIKEGGQ
jgi:hypothetical protein